MRVSRRLGILLVAALLPQAAMARDRSVVTGALDEQGNALVDDFVAICMKGHASFPIGAVRQIASADLPGLFRSWYPDNVKDTHYYRLTRFPYAYVLSYDRPDAIDDQYKQVCALGVQGLPAMAAYIRIAKVLGFVYEAGALNPRSGGFDYIDTQSFDYLVNVRVRINGGGTQMTIMQTSFFNDADRSKRLAAYTKTSLGKPANSMGGNTK